MAKILFGAGIGDARGSIGALTFSKNRFGAVARSKVSPVQPRSGPVLQARGRFGTNSKEWATLTAMQITGWNAYAATVSFTDRFGNSYHPTGLQLFQMCNANLKMVGATPIQDAPTDLSAVGLLTVTSSPVAGTPAFSVAWTATPAAADHYVVVAASNQFSPGRSYLGGKPKVMGVSAEAGASPLAILTAYNARYGALKEGAKIKIVAWTINSINGAASTPVAADVTVGA